MRAVVTGSRCPHRYGAAPHLDRVVPEGVRSDTKEMSSTHVELDRVNVEVALPQGTLVVQRDPRV